MAGHLLLKHRLVARLSDGGRISLVGADLSDLRGLLLVLGQRDALRPGHCSNAGVTCCIGLRLLLLRDMSGQLDSTDDLDLDVVAALRLRRLRHRLLVSGA